jgi:hypothetical protein
MGDLISGLSFAGRGSDLPPARQDLAWNAAEISAVETEIQTRSGVDETLADSLAVVEKAKLEFTEAIASDAAAVIDRLKSGISKVWSTVGNRARNVAAAIYDSNIDRLVAEEARSQNRDQLERLKEALVGLHNKKQALINTVAVEAIGAGLKAELTENLEAARIALTRLMALHQAVDPPPVDYVPVRRAAVLIDGSHDDVELVVETREVDKSLSIILEFKAALERDALAKAPIFPDLDLSIDENVVFHDLRLSEQRMRAANPHFQSKISRKAQTAV